LKRLSARTVSTVWPSTGELHNGTTGQLDNWPTDQLAN